MHVGTKREQFKVSIFIKYMFNMYADPRKQMRRHIPYFYQTHLYLTTFILTLRQ